MLNAPPPFNDDCEYECASGDTAKNCGGGGGGWPRDDVAGDAARVLVDERELDMGRAGVSSHVKESKTSTKKIE